MSALPAILFVDDEAAVLAGLRRQLYDHRGIWDLAFATDGAQALALFDERPFDVVVSDMRMPGMDGARLLELIRERRPETLRVLLSGYADREQSQRSARVFHHFLAKPCDPALLRQTLEDGLALGNLVAEPGLRRRLAELVALPMATAIHQQIQAELERPNTSLRRLGELVECDPSLTARVLQMVNSAYLGLPNRITRASQAAALLGTAQLRSLFNGLLTLQRLRRGHPDSEDERRVWEHGLAVAAEAKRGVKGLGEELEGKAFTAGVLHDVGALVLESLLPQAWQDCAGRQDEALEESVCGASHANAGAYLLGLWGISADMVEAVALHHRGLDDPRPLVRALAAAEAKVNRVRAIPGVRESIAA